MFFKVQRCWKLFHFLLLIFRTACSQLSYERNEDAIGAHKPPPARYRGNPEDRQDTESLHHKAKQIKYKIFTVFDGFTAMFNKPFTRRTTTTSWHSWSLPDVIDGQTRGQIQRQQRNESNFRGSGTVIPNTGPVPPATVAHPSQLLDVEKGSAGADSNRQEVAALKNDVLVNILEGSGGKDTSRLHALFRGVLVFPSSPLGLPQEEEHAQQLQLQGEKHTTKIQIDGTSALLGLTVTVPPPHTGKQRNWRVMFALLTVALFTIAGCAVYFFFWAKHRREYERVWTGEFV